MARLFAIFAALLLAPALLTGCDAAVENLTEKGIEKAAEAGASGDTEVDIDTDSGEFKVKSSDGSFEMGQSGELPEGFPEEVPLVEGTIFNSSRIKTDDGERWSVMIQTDDDAASVFDTEHARFLDAGYESQSEMKSGDVASATYTGDYSISFTVYGEEDGTKVTYGVSTPTE